LSFVSILYGLYCGKETSAPTQSAAGSLVAETVERMASEEARDIRTC
jgi:hypothetical protein